MNLPDFLVDSPDGEIRLTGHRIGLYHFVYHYNEGYSAEMIACQYPTLSLAHIHKVIAFYLENRAEVDAYVAQYRADLERLRAEGEHAPSLIEVRRRIALRTASELAPVDRG
jgi:uncharacterized protein (DUF433 family)